MCEPTGHLTGVFVLERDGAGYRSSSPMNLYASRDEWSAPIQAEVGPDGNVWMLDWYNYIVQHNPTPPGFETGVGAAYESELRDKKYGRIYRIKYVGDEGEPSAAPANLETASPEELVAALRHPTKLWRLHAQRLLVERGKTDVVPALVALVNDRDVDAIGLNVGAIHAMGALQGLVALAGDDQEASAAAAAIRGALDAPVARRAADCHRDAAGERGVARRAVREQRAQRRRRPGAACRGTGAGRPAAERRGAELIAAKLAGDAGRDRWLADALTSAAAMHGVDFVQCAGGQVSPHERRRRGASRRGGRRRRDRRRASCPRRARRRRARHAARRAGRRGRPARRAALGVALQLLARGPSRCSCRRRRTTRSRGCSPTFRSTPAATCCGWPACGTPATPRSCKSSTATRCGRGSRTPS